MAFTAEDAIARQKAIDNGKTSYIRPSDGERYTIRNLNNTRHSNNYGGQGGRDEKYVSRSSNRGNKTDNPRAFNLRHGSPQGTDIAEGDRAMARIRKANPGMHADHINDISLSSRGVSWKVQQGRGTHQEYFENFRKANIGVGHVKDNMQPLDPHLNQIVKNQETDIVHRAIQNAGTGPDRLFASIRSAVSMRGMSMNLLGIAPELHEIIDSKTDGALSEGINSTVDKGKQLVVDGINGWKNILTSMVGQDIRNTNYGQY